MKNLVTNNVDMEKINKSVAQKKLVAAWLMLGLLTSTLFVIVCWKRTEDKDFVDAIQWLFNFVGPGMSLIIGSFAYGALHPESNKYINRSYLRVTMGFTIVYISVILTAVLIAPFAINKDMLMMDYLKKFNLILSFLQASLLVLLGIFFVKENPDQA